MASIHRSQLRLDQISGSFFDREGGIIDSLAADSAATVNGIAIHSGSLVGVMSEVVSAIKRIQEPPKALAASGGPRAASLVARAAPRRSRSRSAAGRGGPRSSRRPRPS